MLLILSSVDPCLDCEIMEAGEAGQVYDDSKVFYDAPDLSGGIEGIDYIITYGAEEEDPEVEE